ncbi:MAG: serine--tRNA ligase [Candidatus Omnitrophica bacterium]|nr:serine--tRNA ligase [Candidatus Omnitrophota bacterium]
MLDLKFIRENKDRVKTSLKNRGVDFPLDRLLSNEEKRRKVLTELETLRYKRNTSSKEIGGLKQTGKDTKKEMAAMKDVSNRIKKMEDEQTVLNKDIDDLMLMIPNVTHESTPVGSDNTFNKEIKTWGAERKPKFSFPPRSHLEIAKNLGLINFSASAKMTGGGFALFTGIGARLERALINFMLDLHTKKHGYKEISPPLLVNRQSMTTCGQLPKLEEDMYKLKDEDYFLIPTAEVPLTNIHAKEILEACDLPLYYTAYTPCFRREAGAYGKETKGLIRVHQFDKVELMKYVKPETSYEELEKLLSDAEEVLQMLEIPYRVVALSTGDISFASSKCYDIEAWASSQNAYLEVSSCSNFEDFQARRGSIRYREEGKVRYVHTLNGSGLALPRIVVALLENNQKEDGSVTIPKALQPYMDGMDVIK